MREFGVGMGSCVLPPKAKQAHFPQSNLDL
jgi:hypothetical protein